MQSFNDGAVSIYAVKNKAKSGDKPKERLVLKKTLRYEERTVGIKRYYAAKQANVRVDYVLRVPRQRDIVSGDVAIPNDGAQYRVVQVQYPRGVIPLVADLTLEGVPVNYVKEGDDA